MAMYLNKGKLRDDLASEMDLTAKLQAMLLNGELPPFKDDKFAEAVKKLEKEIKNGREIEDVSESLQPLMGLMLEAQGKRKDVGFALFRGTGTKDIGKMLVEAYPAVKKTFSTRNAGSEINEALEDKHLTKSFQVEVATHLVRRAKKGKEYTARDLLGNASFRTGIIEAKNADIERIKELQEKVVSIKKASIGEDGAYKNHKEWDNALSDAENELKDARGPRGGGKGNVDKSKAYLNGLEGMNKDSDVYLAAQKELDQAEETQASDSELIHLYRVFREQRSAEKSDPSFKNESARENYLWDEFANYVLHLQKNPQKVADLYKEKDNEEERKQAYRERKAAAAAAAESAPEIKRTTAKSTAFDMDMMTPDALQNMANMIGDPNALAQAIRQTVATNMNYLSPEAQERVTQKIIQLDAEKSQTSGAKPISAYKSVPVSKTAPQDKADADLQKRLNDQEAQIAALKRMMTDKGTSRDVASDFSKVDFDAEKAKIAELKAQADKAEELANIKKQQEEQKERIRNAGKAINNPSSSLSSDAASGLAPNPKAEAAIRAYSNIGAMGKSATPQPQQQQAQPIKIEFSEQSAGDLAKLIANKDKFKQTASGLGINLDSVINELRNFVKLFDASKGGPVPAF